MIASRGEMRQDEAEHAERIPRIFAGWYAACTTAELDRHPLRAVEIYDRSFVLFRGPSGQPAALFDRCPHRNVPLSLGRVTEAGHLECKYHGWSFAGDGTLLAVPGRGAPCEKANAISVPTHEAAGLVWIWPSADHAPGPHPEPPPCHGAPGYTTIVERASAPASLHRTAENALDVPHTSILHRGLFRSGARQPVTVTVRRIASGVEAEYRGERPPSGVLSRILGAGSSRKDREHTVEHWDRFLLPATIQVEYRLADTAHFIVTAYALPKDAEHTELLAVATFRTPLPGALVGKVLLPFARRVFEQDRTILRAQSKALRAEGPRYHSTELDSIGQEIWRLLLRAAERDESGPAEGVEAEEAVVRTFDLLA